jgi:hypothetical protein
MASNDNEDIRAYDAFFDALDAALRSADAVKRAAVREAFNAHTADFPIEPPLLHRFFVSISSACSPPATGTGPGVKINIVDPTKPEGAG